MHSARDVHSYHLGCLNPSPVSVDGEHFKMAPLKAVYEVFAHGTPGQGNLPGGRPWRML